MKKSFCLLALLPILLVSCNKDETFDTSKDFQLCKNGDLFSLDFDNTTYDSISNNLDATSSIQSMENNEGVTFIRTSPTCHSCVDFEETFISFIKNNMLDISVYSDSNKASQYATQYSNYLGEDNIEHDEEHTFLNRTPTWYYASKEKGCKIACWGGGNDYYLKTSFFKYASITNIYKFSSIEYLQKGLEKNPNALIYLLNENDTGSASFYKNSLYPVALKSSKPTYILDMQRVNLSEIENVSSYFSSYSLILGNEKANLNDETGLNSLLNSYYN